MAATGFVSSLIAGGVVCILGEIFLEPLAYLLGSTDTILPYTKDYLRIILLGAPWMATSLVLNNQLRFQGSASYAMVGIVTGAIINIALDPLLMFVCKMGIAGAGWATIISQFISFCLLYIGCKKGSNIRIGLKNAQFKWFYFLQIIKGGLPSLSRQILTSFATICLNNAARIYGDAAIAAMGVVQRIVMFGASTMLGFGQGFQPVCGINFGAQRYDRVKDGFWFCVKYSTIFLAVAGAAGAYFAPRLIALFRDDPEVIAFGSTALRFQCVTFWVQGWIVMSTMMQQATGQTIPATFNSVARQGIFFIPAVLILPIFFDALGIQIAQSVADVGTFLAALPIQFSILRKLRRGELRR